MAKHTFSIQKARVVKASKSAVTLESDPRQLRNSIWPFLIFLVISGICVLSSGITTNIEPLLFGSAVFAFLIAFLIWMIPTGSTIKIDAKSQNISGVFKYTFNRTYRFRTGASRFDTIFASPSDPTQSAHSIRLLGSGKQIAISFFKNCAGFRATKHIANQLRLAKSKPSKIGKFDERTNLLLVICYSVISVGLLLILASLIGFKVDFLIIALLIGLIVRLLYAKPKRTKLLAMLIITGIYVLLVVPRVPPELLVLGLLDLAIAYVIIHFLMPRVPGLDKKEIAKYTNPPRFIVAISIVITVIFLGLAILGFFA